MSASTVFPLGLVTWAVMAWEPLSTGKVKQNSRWDITKVKLTKKYCKNTVRCHNSKGGFGFWTLTFWSGSDTSKTAEALSAQKVSKNISEWASSSSHLCALLHSYLPLGLASACFANLRALGAGVGVTAACECPGQPLLSRNHLEPVSYIEEKTMRIQMWEKSSCTCSFLR